MQTQQDLGPFGPDEGPLSRWALAAAVLCAATVALALVRPIARAAGATRPAWAVPAMVAVGVVAATVGMVAAYRAATRAERGLTVGRSAFRVSIVAMVVGYAYAAVLDGSIRLGDFGRAYFEADILRAIWLPLLRGTVNTVKASFLAMAAAMVLGLAIATFALSKRVLFRRLAFSYVDVVRGLPLIVLTFLIYQGLPFIGIRLRPFIAIVTILTVNASAYIAEIFRAGIQSVTRGQMDAARSLGMPYETAMVWVVIPQAARAVIPPLVSESIALIKDSALVYFAVGFTVASADLFGAARTSVASTFSPTPFMAAAIIYLVINVALARVAARLERRVRVGLA